MEGLQDQELPVLRPPLSHRIFSLLLCGSTCKSRARFPSTSDCYALCPLLTGVFAAPVARLLSCQGRLVNSRCVIMATNLIGVSIGTQASKVKISVVWCDNFCFEAPYRPLAVHMVTDRLLTMEN